MPFFAVERIRSQLDELLAIPLLPRYAKLHLKISRRYDISCKELEHEDEKQMYFRLSILKYVLNRQARKRRKERNIVLGPLALALPPFVVRTIYTYM